jgi:hypothetical protein
MLAGASRCGLAALALVTWPASALVTATASGVVGVRATSPWQAADTGTAAVDTPPVGSVRRVYGRVVHPQGKVLAPVGGEQVTLHRVGSDTAGPMDSARTASDGRYSFTYRTRGARDAVYFVSASYDGIAYLSQPLTSAVVRGAEAEITVYDTTSHPIPLHVRGRHLVVSAPAASGLRSIVEVFELSNDTSVTLISPGTGVDQPTWSLALPPGAQRPQVGQGDVGADAVTFNGNRINVFAPIAPGLKQMSFSYQLAPASFPVTRGLPDGAIVMEALLEESGAALSGVTFRDQAPVAIEGRTFRRFIAQDVPARSMLRVTVPVVFATRRQLYIAVVVTVLGAAMLGGLALAFRRRPVGVSPLAGPQAPV